MSDQQTTQQPRRRRSSRSARRRRNRIALIPTAVAGVLAVFVSAAPTGVPAIDAVERAAFVVGVSLAASRSSRISWVVSAGIVAACAGSTLAVAGGVIGLATAIVATLVRKRSRFFGAVVGGAVGLGSMGLSDFGTFGLSLLIGVVAVLPIFVSAIRKLSTRDRRRVRNGVLVVVGAAVVATGLAGMAALLSRTPLREGVDSSRTGIDQARDGDDEQAAASFDRAESAFDEASGQAGAWWALPARAVPIVSQHLGAVRDLSSQAAELSATSKAAASALGGQEVIADGRIDLVRIGELKPLAIELADVLERTVEEVGRVDVGWLVSPVASQIDDLQTELDDSVPAARNAAEALDAAPTLLGADGPRTYLVLAGNPAESRELGGFVGGFGLLTADAGELSFDTVAYPDVQLALEELEPQLPSGVPEPYAAARPQVFAQNWTDWPDFPEVARVSAEVWNQAGLGALDGTLYTDPATLAALLEFTGPQALPDTDVTLTEDNATEFLLRGQYELIGDRPEQEQRDLLGAAAEVVFDELLDGALPEPQVFSDRLAPLVAQRRLLFTSLDGTAAPLFARTGLDGSLTSDATDLVAITQSNTRANKADAYLERIVDVDVQLDDATTAVRSTVTVTLTNNLREGLPDVVAGDGIGDGLDELDNRINLQIYTPWDLTGVTVDGAEAGSRTNEVGDLQRHGTTLVIGGGETTTVVFTLFGSIADTDDYSLEVLPTATAVPDVVSASITSAAGSASVEAAEATEPIRLESPG